MRVRGTREKRTRTYIITHWVTGVHSDQCLQFSKKGRVSCRTSRVLRVARHMTLSQRTKFSYSFFFSDFLHF